MLIIYFKRFLKNKAFAAALILMPVTIGLFMYCFGGDPAGVNVGIAGSGHYTDGVIDVLESRSGNIKFYVYDDEEELKRDTAAGRLECGYIFGSEFEEAFDSGSFKRTIACVKSASTVFSAVINEVVTEAVTEIFCRSAAVRKGDELGITGTDALYDNYIKSDDVFRAQFVTIDNNNYIENNAAESMDSTAENAVRCILAVYIMIGAMLAAVKAAEDRTKGIRRGNYLCILAAALLMTAAAEIIYCIIYGFDAAGILNAAVYCLGVCGFAACIGMGGRYFVLGMLPVLVIGSAAVCPIFFDITEAVPAVKAAAWIFPPKWCFAPITYAAAAAAAANAAGLLCGLFTKT